MIGARAGLVVAVLALVGACGPGSSPAPDHVDNPATYVVTGHLEGVGGPAGAPVQHWPGTIHAAGPVDVDVATDAHGRFQLQLPSGRYVLTGHSPQYGDGRYLCRAEGTLVVRTGEPARMNVLCQMM
jgi:hypothetical protein